MKIKKEELENLYNESCDLINDLTELETCIISANDALDIAIEELSKFSNKIAKMLKYED